MAEKLKALQGGRPKLTAHRGGAAYAPENTMAAFEKALDMGADLVEIDVQLSADGHAVIMHDGKVDRTTNGKGWVGEKPLAELRELDAGSWFDPKFAGEKVLLFEEVVVWAKGRMGLNIELKYGPHPYWYPEMASIVVDILRKHDVLDEVFVHSFDHTAVREVKQLEPRLLCDINYACKLVDPIRVAREVGADILNMNRNYIAPEIVELAHSHGLGTQCFTNSAAEAEAMVRMGVDFIDSDYIDRLQASVAKVHG